MFPFAQNKISNWTTIPNIIKWKFLFVFTFIFKSAVLQIINWKSSWTICISCQTILSKPCHIIRIVAKIFILPTILYNNAQITAMSERNLVWITMVWVFKQTKEKSSKMWSYTIVKRINLWFEINILLILVKCAFCVLLFC